MSAPWLDTARALVDQEAPRDWPTNAATAWDHERAALRRAIEADDLAEGRRATVGLKRIRANWTNGNGSEPDPTEPLLLADRRKYVAMEFRRFIREMILLPCQVICRARHITDHQKELLGPVAAAAATGLGGIVGGVGLDVDDFRPAMDAEAVAAEAEEGFFDSGQGAGPWVDDGGLSPDGWWWNEEATGKGQVTPCEGRSTRGRAATRVGTSNEWTTGAYPALRVSRLPVHACFPGLEKTCPLRGALGGTVGFPQARFPLPYSENIL